MLGLNEELHDLLESDIPFETEPESGDPDELYYESPNTIEERVSAGMAYLDLKYPNHVEKVYLSTLNLSHPYRCVLAQLHDTHFSETSEWLYFGREWCIEHGFYSNALEYDELTKEWLNQYNARKV